MSRNEANDPIGCALDEAPLAQKKSGMAQTAQQPTSRTHPVGEVLETLQVQTLGVMSGTFFDGGTTSEMTPVLKRMHSETAGLQVNARCLDPALEAKVTIDVRCDQDDAGNAGRYQMRATGHVTRQTENGDVDSEFPVSVEVGADDGVLTLDADQMRDGIADAIHSTGKQSP